MTPATVSLLLFGSGFCALIYQTTWLREFRLIFGATTPASAAVLAIFMGGLGAGSAWLGRRSEKQRAPLAYYGRLELCVALTAALTPFWLWLAGAAYVEAGGTQRLGLVWGTGVRLILSALVLAAPTFLMGGTLPAAARAVENDEDVSRRRLALLYGMNTLGAVAGAALATFFLLEHFGNRASLWMACALNVALALVAIRLGRPGAAHPRPMKAPSPEERKAEAAPRFIYAAACVAGFVFLLMEIVWYRLLTPLLGGTAFTFGLILAVALLGVGIGGMAYAWLAGNRPATLRTFAFTCLLEAACLGYPLALGDRVAVVAALLRPLGSFEFYGHVLGWTVVASLVILPAAVVAGFQFPLLIGLLGRGDRQVGRHTGQAYAWNTAGAIAGSLAGGFGLLPLLTAPGVWRVVIGLLILLGAAAFLSAGRLRWTALSVTGAAGLTIAALLSLTSTGPTAAWRHAPIGAGRVVLSDFDTRNHVRDWLHSYRRTRFLQFEGREVGLAVDNASSYSFVVNGKSDGSARHDAGTQVMCGMLTAMVHPKPTRAFVVGLGTGSTAGWLGVVPGMEQVDVAELEPSIREVARLCAPVNRAVLSNPKVNVMLGDGRELLLTTPQRYDLIVSEPSNPYRAGVAGLFTRDFYRVVLGKLREGGIFAQWVQGYETDLETIRTVIATLQSVFPFVELWQTQGNDLMFLSSKKDFVHDLEALRAHLHEEPFKTALEKAWRVTDLEGVMAHFLANARFCRRVALSARRLNTDDRMVLEFAYGRTLGGERSDHVRTLRDEALALALDKPSATNGVLDWVRVNERRASARVLHGDEPTVPRLGVIAIQRAKAEVSYVHDDFETALKHWKAQPGEPRDLIELTMVAELFAEGGDPKALPYIDQLRVYEPVEADALLGRFYWRKDDPERAVQALEKAFQGFRADPWPQPELMSRAIRLAREIAEKEPEQFGKQLFATLEQSFAVSCANYSRHRALLKIAEAIDGEEFSEHTLKAVQAMEPHVPWDRDFLKRRADCYRQLNEPRADAAQKDLELFLASEPPPLFPEEKRPTAASPHKTSAKAP